MDVGKINKTVILKETNMKKNILLSTILAGMISIPLSGVYAADDDIKLPEQHKLAKLSKCLDENAETLKMLQKAKGKKASECTTDNLHCFIKPNGKLQRMLKNRSASDS